MAKIKILKNGFTDINSADISNFALHSDYKCQKIALADSKFVILPAESGFINGDSASAVLPHNLGYIPMFFAFVEYGGKGYEAVGNANPQIPVQQMQFFAVDAANNYIAADAHVDSGYIAATSHVTIGDVIQFKSSPGNAGVLPAPLQPNTNYYVKSIVDSSKFTISTTPGGAILDLTNSGGSWADIMRNITHPYFGDTGVGFNIDADATNLNITVFPTGLDFTALDETFTIRVFFIADEII